MKIFSFLTDPVSMVSVQNIQDVYYVGEVINCTANGNPSPDFRWEPVNVPQMTGARVYDSHQLEITRNLIGKRLEINWTLTGGFGTLFKWYKVLGLTCTFSCVRTQQKLITEIIWKIVMEPHQLCDIPISISHNPMQHAIYLQEPMCGSA